MANRLTFVVAVIAAMLGYLGIGTAAAQAPAVLGGGSGILIGGEALCTLTSIGHDSGGRLVGLTAGHCGEPGQAIVSESRQDVGTVGRIAGKSRDLDYAVIDFDPAKVVPVNRIGSLTINSVGSPAEFPDVVCKQGLTTGNTCGVVWGDLLQSNETWTQLCVIEGDSGSPVVRGTTLVGMVNAYLGVACLGPELGTDIDTILADLNAHGGVGAGFRPI